MTNEELIVMRSICGALIEARDKRDAYVRKWFQAQNVNEQQDKDNSSLRSECNDLREREADALNAAEEIKAELLHTQEERDEARRKLGALLLCVGFDEAYFKNRPTRALNDLRNAVKKCIDDNHIVLTEGGMAK